jgi:hemerythrin superfamily protein
MATPQQRELARNGLSAADPKSAKTGAGPDHPDDSGATGPVPEGNQAGRKEKRPSDKPDLEAFVAKAAHPGGSGTAPGAQAERQWPGVLGFLANDHREVDALFDQWHEERDPAVVDQIIRRLSIHSALEEQFLYPTITFFVTDGRQLAAEAMAEHQQVAQRLAALERADDEKLAAQMTALIADVRHHVKEEESDLFPRVEKDVRAPQLRALEVAMRLNRPIAPTHPHPNIPLRPFLVPVLGLLDRTRDVVSAGRNRSR